VQVQLDDEAIGLALTELHQKVGDPDAVGVVESPELSTVAQSRLLSCMPTKSGAATWSNSRTACRTTTNRPPSCWLSVVRRSAS
jgi:hypothetical protein